MDEEGQTQRLLPCVCPVNSGSSSPLAQRGKVLIVNNGRSPRRVPTIRRDVAMKKILSSRLVATTGLILALAASGLARDGALSARDLDARIDQAVYRTISIGVPLYNQGDQ